MNNLLLAILLFLCAPVYGQDRDSLWLLMQTTPISTCDFFCYDECKDSKIHYVKDYKSFNESCSYKWFENYTSNDTKWLFFYSTEFDIDSLNLVQNKIIGIDFFSEVDRKIKQIKRANKKVQFPNLLWFNTSYNKIIYDFLFESKHVRYVGMNMDCAKDDDFKKIFSLEELEMFVDHGNKNEINLSHYPIYCKNLQVLEANIDLSEDGNIEILSQLKKLEFVHVKFSGQNYSDLLKLDFIPNLYIHGLNEEKIKKIKECCPRVIVVD